MLSDTGLSKIFPNKIPQDKEIKAKINETTSKKLLHSKRNDQQNHHQTNGRRYLQIIHLIMLMSKVDKELLQLNNNNLSTFKDGKRIQTDVFLNKDTWMANMHRKKTPNIPNHKGNADQNHSTPCEPWDETAAPVCQKGCR